ncbi:MAG: hypothetical protein SV598_00915 [Pseudomonadota bacterium]|nr:hypothetical protein [Pseudomonadota bacterium]
MDSITQVALGASVAGAVAGRTLGRTALLIGGALGTLPLLAGLPEVRRLEWFTGGFLDYASDGNRVTATDIRLGLPGAHPFTFVVARHNGGEFLPTTSRRLARPSISDQALAQLWARVTGQSKVLCLATLTTPAPGQAC